MMPKSRVNEAIVTSVIFLIALLYLATLVFQSNNPSNVKNEAKDSPVVINLYVDEGEVSTLLEGIIESSNVFADDMQKAGDQSGVDMGWRRVEVEKGLVIRLRSMQIRPESFYYKYPGKSDFCITKINIQPDTKISTDPMIFDAGGLSSVERYEYVNGQLTKKIDLILSEEFKGGACPTPSGNIIYSEKETA